MKSRFVRTVYEKNGFCIYAYHTEDASVPQGARSSYYKGDGCEFTAIGNNLPANKLSEVDLHGDWEKNSHGVQFKVDYFEEIRPQSVEGIESYLASGMVKGIGPKTAKLIVEKYGTRTFEILDDYPESLLEIKGITRKKLDKILSAYQDSHAVRDLAAYLTPFKVTPKKIRKIYEHFGNAALDVVKNQPFALCEISGFGFLTVDEIARANHCRPNEPLRIEGCIGYCMELEMQNGNLYADKQKFQKQVHGQLNRGYAEEVVTEVEVYKVMYQMVHDKALYYEDGALYSAKLYHFETQAAKDLATLLVQTYMPPAGLEDLITQAQKDLLLLLSDKQVEAVKKAFTNLVSIITGGPGTGKTTVQRVLLYISEKLGEEKILLTAPTGRASRRMAESTGKSDALTLHSALGLNNDEECEAADEMLSEDFIIADEFTMADMRLSYELFKHIEKGIRVVIVGDVDQLPSVGPGNVFRELVLCALDGQHAGKSQLVHLLCKERNGFKAGLALGGATRKGSIVAQTIVIYQIAEWEAVAEQDSLARRAVHGGLVRAIQRGKLFDIGGGVGGVGILVIGIKLLQGFGNHSDQHFGIFQGQPNMLVSFLLVLVLLCILVLVLRLLHPLNDFFRFYGITQYLQQIDNLHIPVGGISQSILHPFVGLAAYIDKQVAI